MGGKRQEGKQRKMYSSIKSIKEFKKFRILDHDQEKGNEAQCCDSCADEAVFFVNAVSHGAASKDRPWKESINSTAYW